MANISNVINVALIPEGQQAARDNMNVVALMTSQQDGPLSSAVRTKLYSDATAVAEDFGSNSDAAGFANAFFGTTPNPVNFGGVLVMGYWRGASEDVAATAAQLSGTQIIETTVLDSLQSISDGQFNIDIDGTTVPVAGLDFRTATEIEDVRALIATEIGAAGSVVFADSRFTITSATTGALSTITLAADAGTGTFVGSLLGLSAGTGAVATNGAAAETLTAETKVDAITATKAAVNIKGFAFIDSTTDQESKDLAAWSQANSVLGYDVFSAPSNLNVDVTNPVWEIRLSGQSNYRMLFSKSGNRKFAASYMARAHTVNFNADNSALTMHLKELAVLPESYSEAEIKSAKTVGLDIYTTIKNVPVVLTSGANDFMDNRYNLIAYIDAVQTDMFNVLKATGTKIPQTRQGVNQLVDQGEKTSRQFVRAGVFAPGEWSSPDSFGELDVFKQNIRDNGFYWLAGSLADQPQADRQARKSPVLQAAVKNAGAVHSADIIINFNL